MNKLYYNGAATIFSVVAVLHFIRIVQGWDAVIAGVEIPLWFSGFAVILAGYMAVRGFQLGCKCK